MLNKIQKNQIKKALLKLGFTEKETLVYLSILTQSESSVPAIAKDIGLSRGTVYDIVEKLKAKGFLAESKKGKKRRVIVENPTSKFYSLLDEKHDELKKAKDAVDDVLPLIKSVNASEGFKPQVRVYAGDKGLRKVWDEIFSYKGKKWLAIARIENFIKFAGKDFFEELERRKVKLGFTSRAINENSPLARKIKSL